MPEGLARRGEVWPTRFGRPLNAGALMARGGRPV